MVNYLSSDLDPLVLRTLSNCNLRRGCIMAQHKGGCTIGELAEPFSKCPWRRFLNYVKILAEIAQLLILKRKSGGRFVSVQSIPGAVVGQKNMCGFYTQFWTQQRCLCGELECNESIGYLEEERKPIANNSDARELECRCERLGEEK